MQVFHHKDKNEDPPHHHHHHRGVSMNERICAYTPVIYMVILLTVIIFISDLFYHPISFSSSTSSPSPSDLSLASSGLVPSSSSLRGGKAELDLPNINTEQMKYVDRLIVIPGGGGGATGEALTPGYPEWTRRRVVEAAQYYKQTLTKKEQERTLFVLLSAGSFNTPNAYQPNDHRIIFENQHMINHLKELEIPSNRIFADIFSWDTVTNGLSLRLVLEGIGSYHPRQIPTTTLSKNTRQIVNIEVFISDFHLKRVETSFIWSLGLQPSMLHDKFVNGASGASAGRGNVAAAFLTTSPIEAKLHMHSVSSGGIAELTPEALEQRAKHEEKGIEVLRNHMKTVKTLQQFYAFLMLGGHLGIRNYLMNDYVKSSGVGW